MNQLFLTSQCVCVWFRNPQGTFFQRNKAQELFSDLNKIRSNDEGICSGNLGIAPKYIFPGIKGVLVKYFHN